MVWLYSRLLQLAKDSLDENSLLNAFPGQFHPTSPFPAHPKAACLMSRMPKLVVGAAVEDFLSHDPGGKELFQAAHVLPCPPGSGVVLGSICLFFLSLAWYSLNSY